MKIMLSIMDFFIPSWADFIAAFGLCFLLFTMMKANRKKAIRDRDILISILAAYFIGGLSVIYNVLIYLKEILF